jgi:two-component system cell cycle sensor histidine kinase PleC
LLALAPVSTDPEALQVTITELPEDRRMERLARQRADDLTSAVGLLTERYDSVREVERERNFLSSVCHEVQISVDAVAGYIELLAADLQRPAGPLAEIHTRMRRLSTVVGDLADLATDGSEERPLRVETVDLEDIVEEAASVVYTEAERKQQRLIIDIDEEAAAVRADPRLLRRLLVRLLAHAVRATPAHGTVRVSASRPNDSCLVGVSDGGLPVDEDPAVVFRPFAKFHSEALRGDAAPGPALALAKQLVETQGGTIWVERPAKGGNTFCFSIPQ